MIRCWGRGLFSVSLSKAQKVSPWASPSDGIPRPWFWSWVGMAWEWGQMANEGKLESLHKFAWIQLCSKHPQTHINPFSDSLVHIHRMKTYWILGLLNKPIVSEEAEHIYCCQSLEVSWTRSSNSCTNISYIDCLPHSTSLEDGTWQTEILFSSSVYYLHLMRTDWRTLFLELVVSQA